MPKTQELNGLAERMNRTIMERVRSMLSHVKLPKSYWAEAMYTVFYLINRSPSVPLKGDVPQRVWIGKDVSYQHLRVFGCLAYMHVPKDQGSKLDSKSKACIFMGYSEDEFSYKLWDLVDKKLLPEVNGIHLEKCVGCLVGKQNRVAFHSRPPRRREATLELVHTDLCYVDAPSHRGGPYFVTFIDDYS